MAEYRIIVDFKGGQGGDGYTSTGDKKKKEKDPIPELTFAQKFENSAFSMIEKGMNAFSNLAPVALAVEMGENIFSHEMQRIGRYTGSQYAQDVANMVVSAAGKVFNPFGSIINLAYEESESRYQKTWESIGIQLDKERGGASLNYSRTGV